MASSYREHGQDKTVLSCLRSRCELNWRQVKTVCDWKFRNSFVQSRNAVWTESCFQLFARNVVTYCDVIFGNWVKTSSHHRRDWTKLSVMSVVLVALRTGASKYTTHKETYSRPDNDDDDDNDNDDDDDDDESCGHCKHHVLITQLWWRHHAVTMTTTLHRCMQWRSTTLTTVMSTYACITLLYSP